jgi:hypothetical protein
LTALAKSGLNGSLPLAISVNGATLAEVINRGAELPFIS